MSGGDLARQQREEERPTLLPTACPALDRLLEGGLARGRLVEMVGGRSSGRFALTLSLLAAATQAGEVAAFVDLGDGLDPEAAERAGVELERLLWLRPLHLRQALLSAEMLVTTGFPLVALDLGVPPVPHRIAAPSARAAWLRLARTADAHRTAVLVSSPYRTSGSAASEVLDVRRAATRRSDPVPERDRFRRPGPSPELFLGVEARVSLEKTRRSAASTRGENGSTEWLGSVVRGHSRRAGSPPLRAGGESTPLRPTGPTPRVAHASSPSPENRAVVRVACLLVPLFPLAARLRSEPELKDEALAVLEGQANRARVVAATRTVRKSGVRPGMTLPQARALLPGLVARARDEECERAAREALLEVAESFSPRVEDGGEGLAYLDVTGLERMFPAEDLAASERAAGEAMVAAGDAAGVPVWVGIAAGKLAARVAAEEGSVPTVVPAGDEAGFLASLPLHRLCPEVRLASTLESWGVRSVGDLARLPEAEVSSRLGVAGRRLLVTARGEDAQPLTPWRPPPSFREGMDLEWPLVALEPFLFVARAALERLCLRLEAQGFACRRLELELRLEPEGHDRRSLQLPAATADAKVLLTLVRLDLEARRPGAAVAGFAFEAHPHEPRGSQLSIFGPEALAPDRLATTIARLFTLLGPDRVGSPRAPDGHRPERLELVPYEPPPPPTRRQEPRKGMGLLTVRVLRPPVALEVLVAGDAPRVGVGTGEGRRQSRRAGAGLRRARGHEGAGTAAVGTLDGGRGPPEDRRPGPRRRRPLEAGGGLVVGPAGGAGLLGRGAGRRGAVPDLPGTGVRRLVRRRHVRLRRNEKQKTPGRAPAFPCCVASAAS